MKKLLSLSLAAALSVSLLAGCGGGGGTAETNTPANTASSEPGELSGEITFWHSFTQGARMEAIQAAADQFMADNPGVTINIETMSWGDFNTKWNAGVTILAGAYARYSPRLGGRFRQRKKQFTEKSLNNKISFAILRKGAFI